MTAFAVLFAEGCTCSPPRPGTSVPPTDAADSGLSHSTPSPGFTGDTGEPLSWVQVDMGGVHSCGLLSDGRVVCWGADECEEAAPGPGERFVQISEGNGGGCHLREDGTISCMCCAGGESSELVCEAVPEGRFLEVRIGGYHACALDEARLLHCWGGMDFDPAEVPTQPLADFAVESNGGCGVTDSGKMLCWGNQLWDGDAPPEEVFFTRVAPGRRHACGLAEDQNIYCWGYSSFEAPSVPFPAPPPGPYVQVESYNQISCGMRPDGSLECWYDFPQLNDGWSVPDERFVQFSLGEWDACGITTDGRAVCWPESFDTEGEVTDVPSLEDL